MKHLLFIIAMCIFVGCSSDKIKNNVIDINNPQEVSFYNIFSSVDVIPLETTEHSLFHRRRPTVKFIIYNDNFYISDMRSNSIIVFDASTGMFVKKIDHLGRGQGEYLNLEDFNINRFTGNLEILSHENILVYDLATDKYLEKYKIPVPPKYAVNHFINLDKNTDVFYSRFEQKKITVFSRETSKVLREYYELPEFIAYKTVLNPLITPFYVYNDTVKFYQDYNGDIFSINPQNYESQITHKWNMGEHEIKLSYLSDDMSLSPNEHFEIFKKLNMKYASHFAFNGENSKYIISFFSYKQEGRIIFKDKNTGKSYVFSKFKENFELLPELITEDAIYSCIQYKYIPLYVNMDLLSEETKEKINKLTEEDNDVIIKYVFRK
jgi:hypothetical protein